MNTFIAKQIVLWFHWSFFSRDAQARLDSSPASYSLVLETKETIILKRTWSFLGSDLKADVLTSNRFVQHTSTLYFKKDFDQILQFLHHEHVDKKGGAPWGIKLASSCTQPEGYNCGGFTSAFVYFSVLNLPFRPRSAAGPDHHPFAADLRFQFTRSIITK